MTRDVRSKAAGADGSESRGESADENGIGPARWLAIHDELLRGLTHALSNRLGVFEALTTVLEHGGAPDERATSNVRQNVEQLHALLQLFRLLPQRNRERDGAAAEPTLITDAVELAVQLVSHHETVRDASIVVERVNDIVPVWANPLALVHAISVALCACSSTPSASELCVILETVGDEVVVRVKCGAEAALDGEHSGSGRDAAAICWLLGPSTAPIAKAGVCEFRVSTLAAHRSKASKHQSAFSDSD